VFIAHIRGFETALIMLGTDFYKTVGSYSWSVLPFFILMGYFCLHFKFGEDLFYAAYRWLGHLKGGMAIATVGACTAFSAIVGDTVSATATMGAVAIPEMNKYRYDNRLSAGCVAAGASLGPIIPPSVAFILYAVLSNMSVGDLFIAGIIPGIILALCFALIIFVWCLLKPNAGPSGARSNWGERATSLKSCGPVIILFIIVIGGIYMGIFTPTEGGAIGATVAFMLGLIMKRWNRQGFIRSLLETGKVTSMVFLIIIGGMMFSRFGAWCNLSNEIFNIFTNLGLSPTVCVIMILLVLCILGFFVDGMALMLIGVPIFHAIAVSMGINPLWFAILVCLAINLGTITPPVGINLFVLKGLNKEIPMKTIYFGAIPFAAGTLLAMVVLFIAPVLVTWLPGILK
jgi:tripartite ATP-independent transporter DctM subunit